jgi:hypothetical protein
MKRMMLLGGVVLLILSGCQSSGNSSRPKLLGSNSQPTSSGLARNPQPGNTPGTPAANTPVNGGFPAPGSNLSQTSGNFPSTGPMGNTPTTGPTSNISNGNGTGRVTTTTVPPQGINPDMNALPTDNRFPNSTPPSFGNGLSKGPPTTGPVPGFTPAPVSNPPGLPANPVGNNGVLGNPPGPMSGPDPIRPFPISDSSSGIQGR